MSLLLFVLGLALLVMGAELLVRGASRLAFVMGVSPLIVGLTVVAFGTSAPELAVSLKAGFSDQAGIVLGNVVGSNIFNVLFILGLSAVIAPLVVDRQIIRLDVPVMIGVSVLVWVLALDGFFSRLEGALLFGGIIFYILFLIRLSRKRGGDEQEAVLPDELAAAPKKSGHSIASSILILIAGLALLVAGARWLVNGASEIARGLGVSELVIGLTLVAVGTSLPEAATSIVASLRDERDIAVGNVVGSNIFNLLAVLGAGALVSPQAIPVAPEALRFDLPFMTVAAVFCLPIFFTGGIISRREGGVFFFYYVFYLTIIIFGALALPWVGPLSRILWGVMIPLTGVGLTIVVLRTFKNKKGRTL